MASAVAFIGEEEVVAGGVERGVVLLKLEVLSRGVVEVVAAPPAAEELSPPQHGESARRA